MNRQLCLNYETFASKEQLSEEDCELIEAAIESSRKAYAPYSKFHVGACLRLDDGRMVCGNNQENASYPQGLCAERVTLFSAAAQYPERTITSMALVASESDAPLSPCGGCRQVLLEYEQRQQHPIRILMASLTGEVVVLRQAADLLPFSFSKENLTSGGIQPQ